MAIVLTHNAKYKPMSFDDMIKPYVMATEEYRKLEAGIADLEGQAESVKQQALLEAPGSKARKQYEDYAAKLEQAASDLASKGLKGVNRKSVLDLNTQYKSSIKPIEDLIKYRSDIAEEQRKLDPRFVVDRDFSQVTLDELMANPNLGYSKYDLEDYGKQAVLEGTSMKSEMNPIYLGKDPTNQNLLYSQGMSDDDLQAWLSGVTTNKELDATVDRIVGNAPQAVRDRVKTDLAKSLRATISTKENKAYDYAQRKNLALFQHNLSEQSKINAEIREANRRAQAEQNKQQNADIAYRNAVFGIGNIVSRGGEGTYSESTNRMKGLVEETTEAYDTAKNNLLNAQKVYDETLVLYNKDSFEKYERDLQNIQNTSNSISEAMARTSNLNMAVPKGYSEYKAAKLNLEKAIQDMNNEEQFLKDFENTYWYLGNNRAERLNKGLALQRHLEAQQTEDVFLNLESTSYDKITAGIARQLKSYPEKSIKSGTVGLVDSKGNSLSKKEMYSILEDPKELGLKVIKEKGRSKLVFTKDNEEYEIKDAGGLESWMKEVSKTQEFLSDFSNESHKNKSNVITYQSNEGFASLKFKKALSEGNIKDFIITNNYKESPSFTTYFNSNSDKVRGEKLGDDLYGYTIVDASSKDMYKVITDSEGNVKSINTASDEINNGIRRNTSVDELIKLGLYKLKDTYAKKQD